MRCFLTILFFTSFSFQPLLCQNILDSAGLTAATPSQVAYSLRKLSSNYSGPAIAVTRASDNAGATIAFNGTGRLSATSLATFTSGVTVSSTLGTSQTGTISSDAGKTGTITIKAIKTGTITTSSSSLTVTGTGTSFITEIVSGDCLFNATNNTFLGVVSSVTNNTTLLLTNYATVLITIPMNFKTNSATVTGAGTNFTAELAIGDKLFNTANNYLGTISTITDATNLTLNGIDAVAASAVNFKGTVTTITGSGTNFTGLIPGDLLISNNITLGIVASIANATSLTLTTKAGGAVSGLVFKSTPGTISFSTFYSSTSVFVNTWYDQSGNGRNAIQLKTTNRARIVNAGTLYMVNERTSVEFATSLTSFLQTSTVGSYLNNTLYTFNKVTAEATIIPSLQLPISTTGGYGPANTISHYGYRNSSQFTVAQYGNDQNFNATPSTTLEVHTSVKNSIASSQFYKNGISLGILTSGIPSHLNNVGLLNIGFYTPTNVYYNGSISEVIVFSTALETTDVTLLNGNQLLYYNIASTYWTGAVSTDWSNTGNWSTGMVPTISSPAIVLIPAGKPNYPVISGISTANSISLEVATSLTITGTMQIAGTINNKGTCTATAGTVQYIGLAPQAIVANTYAGNTVQNIIINNITGVSMAGSITVSGNLNFVSGKLAINSNTLSLNGSITNIIGGGLRGSSSSNLIIGGGTVSPALSFDQTTPGTTNLLNNLTINSTAQVATLMNPLMVNGSLNLADGFIKTTTANSLTLTSFASFNGGSNISFVDGAIVRNTNTVSAYIFPVGKNNTYRPISVKPVSTADGIYGAEFFTQTAPVGTYAVGVTGIVTNEYWDINKTSGPNASVTLNYTGNNIWSNANPTSTDNIFVAHLSTGKWDAVSGTTITGNTGSGITPVSSLVLTSFSPFTFGYGPALPVLSVTLIDFKATMVNDSVNLDWVTVNEFSFANFELERSADGRNFNKIGTVAARNTAGNHLYNLVDNYPIQGLNFYRLKMIDIDGSFKYSTILKVERNGKKTFSVYPNPVSGDKIMLEMRGQIKGKYIINLYSTKSEKIMTSSITSDGTDAVRSIYLVKKIPNGIYYLEITDPEKKRTILNLFIK